MLLVVMVVAVAVRRYHAVPLAGTAPSLRLLGLAARAAALPTPVLLVPRAQRLAAEHEVVVVDDGGNHPVPGAGRAGRADVRREEVGLGKAVASRVLCR